MSKEPYNEIHDHGDYYEFASLKGTQRVQVNSVLSATAVAVITILMFNEDRISDWIMLQLGASIPLLISSSLFYTKTCYRKKDEYGRWNNAASITHAMGYFGIINAITLIMYKKGYENSALGLLVSVLALIVLYSVLDYSLKPLRLREKLIKFFINVGILFFGTLPILIQVCPFLNRVFFFVHKL